MLLLIDVEALQRIKVKDLLNKHSVLAILRLCRASTVMTKAMMRRRLH
jgi:hypothetical protein